MENYKVTARNFKCDVIARDDLAVFYNYGGGSTALYTLHSYGSGFNAPAYKWGSCSGCSYWENYKVTAGNFDGDGSGRDDLAVFYNYGGGATALFTFYSYGSGFHAPAYKWGSCSGCSYWENYKVAPGDFDGDGKEDLAVFYNYGGGGTALFTLSSNGFAFAAPAYKWGH